MVDVPLWKGHRMSAKNKYEPQNWIAIVIVIYQISDLQTRRTWETHATDILHRRENKSIIATAWGTSGCM